MAMKIVILEDNADRRSAMQACLADRFYTFDSHFFDEPAAMIEFLRAHLAETIAISLDNDLDMKPGADGRLTDVGEGRRVAEFLATQEPVCPVVIHTSNGPAADAMTAALNDSGWTTRRVLPFDDTAWILDDWFPAMRRAIVGPIRRTSVPTQKREGEATVPS
jgi:hypothetical protein